MSEWSLDQQIATFLAVCKTASLATVDSDGWPCNANIQFVADSALKLYWVSAEASAHSQNVRANPQAAVTIYAHQDEPEQIHGLQMRGKAKVLDAGLAQDTFELYASKYPFVTGPPYDQAIKKQLFYCFTPAWLRWIDNRRGFGWKREMTFS